MRVALLQFACVVAGCLAAPVRGQPPNILFIFSDDHAPHAISAYGSRINETPNIDRIANEGAIFRQSFCTNSICAPSRAVILTGKFSHLNGVPVNGRPFDGAQPTFPKMLQIAGYQTAMIGKWHLRSEPTGFDYWRVLPGQGDYYNPVLRSPDGEAKIEGYVTDIVTDLAIDWIRGRDPKKPFMLMCQHKAPHRAWMPGPNHLDLYDGVMIPEPATLFDDYAGRTTAAAITEMTIADHLYGRYDLKIDFPVFKYARWELNALNRLNKTQRAAWDAAYGPRNQAFMEAIAGGMSETEIVRWKYQRYIKDYLRCIASVDDNVGRLLDELDASGLAANTVVIYCSDQGFYLGDHGWYDKRWMYEESLRMPFLVRWPDVIRPGTSVDAMIQNVDYAPTFLAMAGVETPGDMQGGSLVPLMRGRVPHDWRKSIYYHYTESPSVHRVPHHYGVRTERYKLIYYYNIDEWELFDLERDPDELCSVYGDPEFADVVARLKSELGRLRARYEDTTGWDFAR